MKHFALLCVILGVFAACGGDDAGTTGTTGTSGETGTTGTTGTTGETGNTGTADTPPVPGAAVALQASDIGPDTFTLGWAAASDGQTAAAALEYRVYRSATANIGSVAEAEANGTVERDWTANLLSHTFTNLAIDTDYHVNVTVRDEAGNKTAYTARVVRTADLTAPVPGASGQLAVSNDLAVSLVLSWTKATDGISDATNLQYRAYRSTSANIADAAAVQLNGTALSDWTTDTGQLAVTNLAAGTAYWFNLLVRDQAGNIAAYVMQGYTTPR